jgi:hypothetical protein
MGSKKGIYTSTHYVNKRGALVIRLLVMKSPRVVIVLSPAKCSTPVIHAGYPGRGKRSSPVVVLVSLQIGGKVWRQKLGKIKTILIKGYLIKYSIMRIA